MLVETTNGFITGLVQSHLPVHLVEEVIVDHKEDWAQSKVLSLNALGICKSLVEGIAALVALKDGSKDGEVGDLDCFALLLHHVAHALGKAAPDHVEELQGLSLSGLERVCRLGLGSSSFTAGVCGRGRILNELQVQLREVPVEVAWVVHALLEQGEFGYD